MWGNLHWITGKAQRKQWRRAEPPEHRIKHAPSTCICYVIIFRGKLPLGTTPYESWAWPNFWSLNLSNTAVSVLPTVLFFFFLRNSSTSELHHNHPGLSFLFIIHTMSCLQERVPGLTCPLGLFCPRVVLLCVYLLLPSLLPPFPLSTLRGT